MAWQRRVLVPTRNPSCVHMLTNRRPLFLHFKVSVKWIEIAIVDYIRSRFLYDSYLGLRARQPSYDRNLELII